MTMVRPMLATLGTTSDIDDEDDWCFEMKWDGIRIVASVDGSEVSLATRNGHDVSVTYPEVVEALGAHGLSRTVLDGEVVALGPGGVPDFGLLQTRSGLTRPSEVAAARRVRVALLVFDVLELDGRDCTGDSYDERRDLLLALGLDTGPVRTPAAFEGGLEDAVATSLELRLEGVLAKRRDSTYRPGKRGGSWIKIKHVRTQEIVIGGWRPGRGGRSGTIGSLLMGVPDGKRLRYVGRVGSGLGERALRDLDDVMPAVRKTSPFHEVPRDVERDAYWVSPRLVGEVAFAEWTSGGQLRQPRWRGIRRDKDVDDVRVESDG